MTTQKAFSPAEIRQYRDIYRRWWVNDKHAIPTRYSRAVVQHAVIWGFLERDPANGVVHVRNNSALDGLDLPAEVLWDFVRPAVQASSGFSITKHPVWRDLNISQRDIGKIEQCLLKLDQAGYITFQASGSIWRID